MGTFHVVSDIQNILPWKAKLSKLKNSDSTDFISELFKLKKTLISCHSIKPTISE